ncbi:unnamed protein product [Macrosiphum euphorbiae]|uniref:Tc1-like transposase DDE domain-containing protein n=2 Tax=Macrosiphum euphorbiae TaxID=13131 RepID=A0AAV0X7B3_9HEMI|nr:unnamed protein product [Macrosiphum euphorbiae]
MSCNCSAIMKQLQKKSDADSSRSRSPIKKNPKGKRVDSGKRLLIINTYKSKLAADPEKSIRILRQEISKELGIGATTISKTIMVYNRSKIVISPCRTRAKISARIIFDEFQRNVVRRHVHSFWFKREIPTVDKIYQVVSNDESLPPISRTSLFRILKEMGFKYSQRSGNGALTEKSKIVLWRRRFLEDLKKYREEGRHIYYLDETSINSGECTIKSPQDEFLQDQKTGVVNSSGKDKHLIVLNIGSEDGFVPEALLCFESKKNSRNSHDEINGETFNEWIDSVLPRLKKKCVIIMDNASYHSVKVDKAPTSKTEKANIIKWLKDKNEIIDRPMVIPQLLEIVKRVKHDKYVVDELAKQYDSIILRLPPHHCELNPMELAWSAVKNYVMTNNTTYKLTDVEELLIEGVERVKPNMWKDFISQTKKEEDKFWKIDFIVDDVLSAEVETVTMTIGDTSSDESSITSD